MPSRKQGLGGEREKEGKQKNKRGRGGREIEKETYVQLIFKARQEGWREPAKEAEKGQAKAQSHC